MKMGALLFVTGCKSAVRAVFVSVRQYVPSLNMFRLNIQLPAASSSDFSLMPQAHLIWDILF